MCEKEGVSIICARGPTNGLGRLREISRQSVEEEVLQFINMSDLQTGETIAEATCASVWQQWRHRRRPRRRLRPADSSASA